MQQKPTFKLPVEDLQYICAQARADLQSLKNARIFMTGCTSFFGKWLIESLLWANLNANLGLQLTVLSRDPEAFLATMPHFQEHQHLALLQGDICSFSTNKLSFTHVIHGANLQFDGREDWPVRHIEAAIHGTKYLMDAAKACGCQHALFISSGAAYKAEPSCIMHAKDGVAALGEKQTTASDYFSEPNIYGLTKRYVETYMTALGSMLGLRTTLARCFAFAGPYMPLKSLQALNNFISAAIASDDLVIKGDGRPIRSYMYGADLVVWLLAILCRGKHGVPYNVGSEQGHTIHDLAKKVARFSPGHINVSVLGKINSGNAPDVYIPDTNRARHDLTLHCQFDIDEILAKTFRWLHNNQN